MRRGAGVRSCGGLSHRRAQSLATCRQFPRIRAEVESSRRGGFAASESVISANTRPGRGVITTIVAREIDGFEYRMRHEHHRRRSACQKRSRSLLSLKRVISSSAAKGSSISRRSGRSPGRGRWRRASACRPTTRVDRPRRIQRARRAATSRDRAFGGAHAPASCNGSATFAGDIRPWHQGRLLEDEAERASRLAATPTPPAGGRAQSRDDAERRRFAAARWPEQRDEFAGTNIEIEAIERAHAACVGFAHAAQGDDGTVIGQFAIRPYR